MNQNQSKTFDPFGALRLFKPLQDAWMEGWSKLMNNAVQSNEINKVTGPYMDAYLQAIEPMQQFVEKAIEKTLQQLQLPTRAEVASLSSRLTSLEKKLDDISAMLQEKKA